MADILLVETSLEGHLVDVHERRSQVEVFRSLLGALDVHATLYHERVSSMQALRSVLRQCAEQNAMKRGQRAAQGFKRPSRIRYVHVNAHGTKRSLSLPLRDGGETATPHSVARAFAEIQAAKVRAIILSACDTGANGELARWIIDVSRVTAVIGYPEAAYDSVCAMAEQMLYYQLLQKPRLKVWDAVRRVNDALVLLGEKDNRLLTCWARKDGHIVGPCPWWGDQIDPDERTDRSYVSTLANLVPERGPMGEGNLQLARVIARRLK
jgi:hypothetical protein